METGEERILAEVSDPPMREALLRLLRGELGVGKDMNEVSLRRMGIHPNDWESVASAMTSAVENKYPHSDEHRFMRVIVAFHKGIELGYMLERVRREWADG